MIENDVAVKVQIECIEQGVKWAGPLNTQYTYMFMRKLHFVPLPSQGAV